MTGFNVIMLIAIILFARLGVRLFIKWRELKKNSSENEKAKKEEPRKNT